MATDNGRMIIPVMSGTGASAMTEQKIVRLNAGNDHTAIELDPSFLFMFILTSDSISILVMASMRGYFTTRL